MNLTGRHFLKLKDYTPEEILYLVDLAQRLKKEKKQGIPHAHLTGKNIALIFEKRLRWRRMILACMRRIWIRLLLRSEKKKASGIRQECLAGCLTGSSTGDTDRIS